MPKRGGSLKSAANEETHQALLMYIMTTVYPEISRDPANDGINMRLAIVGGAAYKYHMNRARQTNTLSTYDVDMKFFVKLVDQNVKQYRARCILMVIQRIFEKYRGMKLLARYRRRQYLFDAQTVNYDGIRNELLTSAFTPDVDLFTLCVNYDDGETSPIVDFSIISQEYYSYAYTQFPRYRKAAHDVEMFANYEFVDGVLETIANGGVAHYASYQYLVVDTLKMIAIVDLFEQRHPGVTVAAVYKYVNYVLKYIHLMLLKKVDNVLVQKYKEYIAVLKSLPAITSEHVVVLHSKVKADGLIAPLANRVILNALIYRGDDMVSGGGKSPSPFGEIDGVNENANRMEESGLDAYLASLDEKRIAEMIQADIQKAARIVDDYGVEGPPQKGGKQGPKGKGPKKNSQKCQGGKK